jgi:hypothetical protein
LTPEERDVERASLVRKGLQNDSPCDDIDDTAVAGDE